MEMPNAEKHGDIDEETNGNPGFSSEVPQPKYVLSKARLTLSSASRLLRRTIPQSGHLMLPRKYWMQTVPTQECEVVVVFTPETKEVVVNWLVTRLRARVPELSISVKNFMAKSSYVLYVAASIDGLVKGGEELRIPKRTKQEFGASIKELSQVDLPIFKGVEDLSTFFTSQEKQSIVLHLINSLISEEGEEIDDLTFRAGQAIVSKYQMRGFIEQILPLHDREELRNLRRAWVPKVFSYQPLDKIQEYFGTKIAIYFAWLGFYTAALTVPATIGLVFWILFYGRNQATEDKAFVVFAFLNVIWSSMWLEAWKRRGAELAHKWGTLEPHHELLAEPRAMFTGDLEVSRITGRFEPVYPTWKRNVLRYFVTIPLVSLSLLLAFFVMFIILRFQDWLDQVIQSKNYLALLSYGPKILMALVIALFDEGYSKLAVWLNDLENYRTDECYHNHLIVKLVVFRAVNSFLALFYIAFYLQDMDRLKEQLAALLLTRQVVGNIKESCVPYILEQLKLAKLSFDIFGALSPSEEKKALWAVSQDIPEGIESVEVNGVADAKGTEDTENGRNNETKILGRNRIVGQAEVDSNMSKYDDTFEDYLEMIIQFGYVTLFSSAFPLAATCAFFNNVIEIRSDAFKLCCAFQRPFGQCFSSIGVWQDVMNVMGLLGVIVNCILIGLSGQVHRMFPEMSTTQTILLIIVLEHGLIALKYVISYVIPDVPEWVALESANAEFKRRQALRNLSHSNSPPTRDVSGPPSPRSSNVSNLSSVELIEKSVQTDGTAYRVNTTFEEFPAKNKALFRRISQEETVFEKPTAASVKLGRSVSACDRSPQSVPKVIKKSPLYLNNSSKPAAESLPQLSAPSSLEDKKHFFAFGEAERSQTELSLKPRELRTSESSSSPSADSTDSRGKSKRKDIPGSLQENSNSARRVSSPTSEGKLKSVFSIDSKMMLSSEEGGNSLPETSRPLFVKRHPSKFLKRAQSLSQVFKRRPERKRKTTDVIKDDFMTLIGEPMGEMSLVPLEELIFVDDIKMSQPSLFPQNGKS